MDSDMDFGELKEFHRTIMDNSAMWLNALDKNARVVMWNRAAEKISGYCKEEVLGRDDIWRLLYPDDAYRDYVFSRARDIIEQGLELENFETTIRCKNGSERVLFWNSHDLKDAHGEVIGSLALARDVTDIRHSQEQLKHALERAEAGSRAKDRFIATTSHEIRTPITAIMGMLDMLDSTELSGQQQEYLDVARTATNILSTTMEDVLDVARLKGGQYQLNETAGELKASLENIATILGNDAGKKGLGFESEISSELPANITIDHARLHQVLMNLGYNAIKFTDSGTITLHADLAEGRPNRVRFVVSDTGIGIADEKLATIFQPFEQADNSTSQNYGGLGLGLSVVSQLLELMRGSIEVSSVVGVGTTITLEIPFVAVDPASVGGSEQRAERRAANDQQSLRILLAEDNELNVFVITSLLKELPHTIEVVSNGKEAVERYEAEHYDLVLMDIRMPKLDGNRAMQMIREIEQRAERDTSHVVALTAHATEEDRVKGLQIGFDDYLTKPINQSQLIEIVEQAGRSPSRRLGLE